MLDISYKRVVESKVIRILSSPLPPPKNLQKLKQ